MHISYVVTQQGFSGGSSCVATNLCGGELGGPLLLDVETWLGLCPRGFGTGCGTEAILIHDGVRTTD